MAITDNDATQTLVGNPHAEAAAFVDDVALPAAAVREALLAVAFEQRTANLIAMLDSSSDQAEVLERLGRQEGSQT
jgi:hypothetical protein